MDKRKEKAAKEKKEEELTLKRLHELFKGFKDIPLGSLSDDYNGKFPYLRKRRGL